MNEQYFTSLNGYQVKDEKAVRSYDTVSDMINDNKLKEGYHVSTKGYYSINDGGGAEYLIRNKTVSDTIDNGSIIEISNTIVAELIIKDNTINLKQFGCKGDGTTDDSTKIQNAFNYLENKNVVCNFNEGRYLCKSGLLMPSGIYKGNNSTIIISHTENLEHFLRNKNYSSNSAEVDTIYIDSLNFEFDTSFGHGEGDSTYAIGLFNTRDSKILNCNIYSNSQNTLPTSGIDLYTNNKNCLIDSCKIVLLGTGSINTTTISIREYNNNQTVESLFVTEDITVRNCYLKKNGIDEIVWIDEWKGTLRNIRLEDSTIYDDGASYSIFWATASENLLISNCNIYIESLKYIGLKLGLGTNVKNNRFINCSVEVNNLTGNSLVVLGAERTTFEDFIIDSCSFRVNNNNSYTVNCIEGPIETRNNKIYGTYNNIYSGLYRTINDDLTNATGSLTKIRELIDGIKYNSSTSAFINNNPSNESINLRIKNSKINCQSFVKDINATTYSTYTVEDSDITFTDWQLFINQSSTEYAFIVNLRNTNLNPLGAQFHLSDNEYYSFNINNITLSNVLFKGIPEYSTSRANCVVGTILPSATSGKSIVRKTSAGNSTSNWEEI